LTPTSEQVEAAIRNFDDTPWCPKVYGEDAVILEESMEDPEINGDFDEAAGLILIAEIKRLRAELVDYYANKIITVPDKYFKSETPICDKHADMGGFFVPRHIAAQLERELHAALKRATTEAVKTMRPASIEDKVIDRIRERQATGRAKYGTTMERTDLDLQQWLQHLQEELLDAAVYVEKLKGEIKP
jgi:hypothetical protein